MDFMQSLKNFNQKKNTDKLMIKRITMMISNNNKFKIIFSSFKNNQFQIMKSKEISM
jgi:hypothetical protein